MNDIEFKLSLRNYKWGDKFEYPKGSVKPVKSERFKSENGSALYSCPKCGIGVFENLPHIVSCPNDYGKDRCGVFFDWSEYE